MKRVVCLLFLFVALAACSLTKGREAAANAVVGFHNQLDSADFGGVYAKTHPDFKRASSEKDFVAVLEAVHRKLGTVRSAKQTSWQVQTVGIHTNVVLNYRTNFSGGDAAETFTYRMDGPNALLLGYSIDSTVLVTK